MNVMVVQLEPVLRQAQDERGLVDYPMEWQGFDKPVLSGVEGLSPNGGFRVLPVLTEVVELIDAPQPERRTA